MLSGLTHNSIVKSPVPKLNTGSLGRRRYESTPSKEMEYFPEKFVSAVVAVAEPKRDTVKPLGLAS